jgi:hypothetical protein
LLQTKSETFIAFALVLLALQVLLVFWPQALPHQKQAMGENKKSFLKTRTQWKQ